LAAEIIVISAHLDAYGIAEPVNGDAIYNGTFDDAAYVATLIQLARQRKGRGFRRPVLFAVMTGEEKGLLGSNWFTQHPTVPVSHLAADINLDGVRPLFPLKILTGLSMNESTLGNAAGTAATQMHIELRPDREPERNMRERTDHWPFLEAGIPSICFMFGFDSGTESERIYRGWYQSRYHKPQDDLKQPFDGDAARDFNEFFYRLLGIVADGPARPALVSLSGTPRLK
jgi:Zn-dependent M28 family amino/carboxypeptidase